MERQNIFEAVFMLTWTAIAGYLTCEGLREFEDYYRSRNWPVTKGSIVYSEVINLNDTEIDSGEDEAYQASIRYTFAVDGTAYEGDRYAHGYTGHSSESSARQLSGRYPSDSIVDVYFDPDNPYESVLNRSIQMDSIIKVLIGFIFMTVGIMGFRKIFYPRSGKKGSQLLRTKGGSVYGRLSVLLGLTIGFSGCAAPAPKQTTERIDQSFYQINERSIVGYWQNRDDGLQVHITGIGFGKAGSGSFKEVNDKLIPAGKFRDIRYVEENRWECQQYRHSPSLRYPENVFEIIWEDAVIELIGRNTFRVGSDIYDRI